MNHSRGKNGIVSKTKNQAHRRNKRSWRRHKCCAQHLGPTTMLQAVMKIHTRMRSRYVIVDWKALKKTISRVCVMLKFLLIIRWAIKQIVLFTLRIVRLLFLYIPASSYNCEHIICFDFLWWMLRAHTFCVQLMERRARSALVNIRRAHKYYPNQFRRCLDRF